MKKIFLIVLISFLALFTPLLRVKSVNAAEYDEKDCPLTVTSTSPSSLVETTGNPNEFYYSDEYYRATGNEYLIKRSFKFSFDTSKIEWSRMSSEYRSDLAFEIPLDWFDWGERTNDITSTPGSDGPTRIEQTNNQNLNLKDGAHIVNLIAYGPKHSDKKTLCTGSFNIVPKIACKVNVTSDSPLNDIDSNWTINVTDIEMQSSSYSNNIYFLVGDVRTPTCDTNCWGYIGVSGSTYKKDIGKITGARLKIGVEVHIVPEIIVSTNHNPTGPLMCANTFNVYPIDKAICEQSPCKTFRGVEEDYHCSDSVCQECSYCRLHPTPTLTPFPTPTDNPILCRDCQANHDCSGLCGTCSFCPTPIPINTTIPLPPNLVPLCDQVDTPGTDFRKRCRACVIDDGGMWTAIGCLPTAGLESFLKDYLFTFGIGLAGGIAFLYFLYGSFLFLTSAGNAETVGQAKEIIISAVSGLIFILLSIFFLKIIGADILRIPGFS